MKVTIVAEKISVETVAKAKKGHTVRVCRAKRSGPQIDVRWKDLRFVNNAFTAWPRGWGAQAATAAQVERVIEEQGALLDAGTCVAVRPQNLSPKEYVSRDAHALGVALKVGT